MAHKSHEQERNLQDRVREELDPFVEDVIPLQLGTKEQPWDEKKDFCNEHL